MVGRSAGCRLREAKSSARPRASTQSSVSAPPSGHFTLTLGIRCRGEAPSSGNCGASLVAAARGRNADARVKRLVSIAADRASLLRNQFPQAVRTTNLQFVIVGRLTGRIPRPLE